MEESMKGFKSLITGKWAGKRYLLRWQQLRLPALARHKTGPVNRQPCTMEGLTKLWILGGGGRGSPFPQKCPTGEHRAPWDSSLSLVSQIALTKPGGPQNETKTLNDRKIFIWRMKGFQGWAGVREGGGTRALNTLYAHMRQYKNKLT